MHIVFGHISNWSLPIAKILKYFKFNVYYLLVDEKSNSKKIELADKLKNNNIYPLPLEFEKKILPEHKSLIEHDPEEIAYKKNIKLVPEKFIKKYCKIFSIDEKEGIKIRLLIQDFIFNKQKTVSGILGIWASLHKEKKIIYVSFDFKCFYISETNKNIKSIVIPLNLIGYFIKSSKRLFIYIFYKFKEKKNKGKSNEDLNYNNFEELSKKPVAFIAHKGLGYGTNENNKLYDKSFYYSNDKNSYLNKNNILHLDYSNYPKPSENIFWVSLKKTKVSRGLIFIKTLLACVRTFYLIRNWPTFLGWLLCMQQYNSYLKYYFAIKKFKSLKIALLDYDILCPKPLILALEKNNIKTVATQERFLHSFFSSYANLIVNTYYTISEYTADIINKSKYFYVQNLIPVGQYRSAYLAKYKNTEIPKEINKAKNEGKKILVVLGFEPPKNWFESYTSLVSNWSSQISFLDDILKLSKNLDNTFIIIRYKGFECPIRANPYFSSMLKKIEQSQNLILSNVFSESFYSYKLCANADLVIAKHSSIADECLSNEIPVLFYDYTHNLKGLASSIFNYSPSELMCYNFEDLLKRSKSLLFDKSTEFKKQITKLNEKIYYVKEKQNVENKINLHLENLINNKL